MLLILIVSLLGVFVINTKQANASIWLFGYDSVGEMIMGLLGWIAYGIFFLVSRLLWMGGMLLDGVLGIQKFTNVAVVTFGWEIVRDVANMFFVLILLLIAFATILHFETYGVKAILPKLIIAALLINFSLVFCGVIIDASQITTQFFLDQIKGQGTISASIMKGLQIQKAVEMPDENIQPPTSIQSFDENTPATLQAGVAGSLSILIGIVMGVIIIALATIAVFAASLFLIVRMLYLWFLIILAPIVWLLWILPATRSHWSKWWNNFLKWAFFAPIYVFFLYLAIYTINKGALKTAFENQINTSMRQGLIGGFWETPMIFFQYLIIIAFLYGALIVAQTTGAYGATGAVGLAKKVGAGAGAWTGKQAWTRFGAPTTKKAEEKLTKVGAEWQAEGGAIRRLAGRGLGQIARAPRAISEAERKAMAGLEAKYKSWTDDHLKSEYARATTPRDKAAIAKQLATRGELAPEAKFGFTEDHIKEATKLAKRYEEHGDIIKARPDLAPSIDKNIEETVSKLKPAHMEKLQTEALIKTDPETGKKEINKDVIDAVKNQLLKKTEIDAEGKANNQGKWKSNHLIKLAETNPEVFRVIIEEVKKDITSKEKWNELKKERSDIADYLESAAGKSIFGEFEWMEQQPKKESIISSPTKADFEKAKEKYQGR